MKDRAEPLTLMAGGQEIPFLVRPTHKRRVELRFDGQQPTLLIYTPSGKMDANVWQFVRQKEQWIARTFAKVSFYDEKRRHFLQQLEAGIVPYLGQQTRFQLQKGPENRARMVEGTLQISYRPADQGRASLDLIYSALRSLGGHHIKARLANWAEHTGSHYEGVRIKDQKSKWGSCSSKRNLNFNWHAILLPPHLIDYLIIHELMHLREMNHSPRFWAEVERYWPTYKQAEKELSGYDWIIGIFEWIMNRQGG